MPGFRGGDMDDIDGWPEVTGYRLGHEAAGTWTVTLTPAGLDMRGPERSAQVELGAVTAVRQRPTNGQPPEEDLSAQVIELEWVTSLMETRTLALITQDTVAAQRLAGVVTDRLRELDEEGPPRRRDWFLVFLIAASFIMAVRDYTEKLPLTSDFDRMAAMIDFAVELVGLPLLYLLLRAVFRWARRRWRSRAAAAT
jgi:hypothetical protein